MNLVHAEFLVVTPLSPSELPGQLLLIEELHLSGVG